MDKEAMAGKPLRRYMMGSHGIHPMHLKDAQGNLAATSITLKLIQLLYIDSSKIPPQAND
jgi:hypothetical protein